MNRHFAFPRRKNPGAVFHLVVLAAGLMAATAFAQKPFVAMDETAAPEMKVGIWWNDVPNATQYKLYREFNPKGTNLSCLQFAPNAMPIATITDNGSVAYFYSDDPAPGLWQQSVNGPWRAKIWWCYAVTSVVNGVESAKQPVAVAVADDFYFTIHYMTACTNGQILSPYPYPNNQLLTHFYYTDASGVKHEIPVEHVYGNGTGGYASEEWEGRLPIIALDGTTVSWVQNGNYTYTVDTPDGGHYRGTFAPLNQLDASYYNQRNLRRTIGADCPLRPGESWGNYDWWQNVVR